jgi:hypothetical protein
VPFSNARIELVRRPSSGWRVVVNDIMTTPVFPTDSAAAEYAMEIRTGHRKPDFDLGSAHPDPANPA